MRIYSKIRSAEVRAGISESGSAWYRGEAQCDWKLLPKLFRYKHSSSYLFRAENALFADFRSDYERYIKLSSVRDSWDVLAAMQHYGVSTRLLDWTTELDIALYFAVGSVSKIQMNSPKTWPCLWVLNPYRLNKLYIGEDVVFDRADPIPYDYYDQTIRCIRQKEKWPHELPIAMNPGFTNDRMAAQHGRFTIHGNSLAPLDAKSPESVGFWGIEKVVIDPNDFGELRKHASKEPAYHLRVYPDLGGYTRFLNHREGLFP